MKMLLLFFTFVLFTFVSGMPEKCDTMDGEYINNCNELKKLSHESKNGRTIVTKYDCACDGDVHRVCSQSEINKCAIQKTTLDRRQDIEHGQSRSAEQINNNVHCDRMQGVVPDQTSTGISSDTELNYSEECTVSNKKIGEITSHETINTMTSCCGIEANSKNKIYGGTEIGIYQYPWLALLEYERPYLCVGTLISSFYVLSAAHCLVAANMKSRKVKSVRLGEYNMNNDGRDCVEADGDGLDCTDGAVSITIRNTIVHPEYNNVNTMIVQANDIGLLMLTESSPYTDFIRPICLPRSDVTQKALSLGFNVHTAGWGGVSDYQQRSDVKLQVALTISNLKVCEKLYSINGKPVVWDKQICAGVESNINSCKGNSGGPLIYSDYDKNIYQIVGIKSFGILNCRITGRPSIYTNVIKYVPWIIANMKPLDS